MSHVPRLFASDDDRDLVKAERDVRATFTDLDLDLRALTAVSNIFRAATAVRNHMENRLLAEHDLSDLLADPAVTWLIGPDAVPCFAGLLRDRCDEPPVLIRLGADSTLQPVVDAAAQARSAAACWADWSYRSWPAPPPSRTSSSRSS